jgi:hypothetical protein
MKPVRKKNREYKANSLPFVDNERDRVKRKERKNERSTDESYPNVQVLL